MGAVNKRLNLSVLEDCCSRQDYSGKKIFQEYLRNNNIKISEL